MKNLLIGTLVAGVIASPALAGSSANWRSLNITPTDYMDNGRVSGYGYTGGGGGPAGALANLYQNIPAAFGGLGTAGGMTPMGLSLMYFFVRWTPTAGGQRPQWGDDLHGISAMGAGPAVVTAIQYGYFTNNPGTLTVPHIIKLYDMINPSQPHNPGPNGTGGATVKGPLLRQITFNAPPATMGAFVTIPIAPLQLPAGSIWIKFDQAVNTQNTFWLSGGLPYNGSSSHNGLTYSQKTPPAPGQPFNSWAYFPGGYINLGGTNRMVPNIAMGLKGFHVPAPAVISLLALGGLASLRRRRASA